jgi:hypothetical protein
MTEPALTYPDAPGSLIARWEKRRQRLTFGPDESLPPRDVDLAPLAGRVVAPPAPLPDGSSPHARKWHDIRQELAGRSELAALNAILIAHLRKRRAPRDAAPLFRRIWAEQAGALIAELSARWLISSAITFGDHGMTEGERSLGREVNVLFSLIKLYEFERLQGGSDPTGARMKRAHPGPLPLQMEPFSLLTGGLDVNLLAPIWARAEAEPVMGPLVLALLDRLNAEPGVIFRRLAALRGRRAARVAASP